MDMKELKIFLTAAEFLHFGRASQACNLSPSALTRTIQRLEEELGQALFERDNRTVQLSYAGEQFSLYAKQALHDYASFLGSLSVARNIAGTLSLYASVTAVYSILPDLLEAYRKAYPEVHLELRTGAAEGAVNQVEAGEIDIAVAALPDRRNAGVEFLPIMTTPLIFIAGKQFAASILQKGSESLKFDQLPLVLPQSGLSRRRLDKWLRKNHIVPTISSEVSGNEAIVPMVNLGCGVGIVPRLVLERSPFRNEVVILRQAPQLEPYIVGLCSTKQNLQKAAVQALWQLAESQIS
ncbi:transcriptional regulator, LysR family [Desulfuromusa kysingii]|uniref:Transcriptional regulator, LysR family n=1 Tax=Desulfuromusa kysingii TaxID=37625 RepID=A0A1H3Y6C1_9BACT|nr:HTH-type transcriptional activator IlvY [Desulfuromusa kysingii]SEA06651.1 transcriptional regulator, LysR family [Desulfuromusa kysingii]